MRGTIGFLHREGKRKSGSLPCEEQVESVPSLLNPHLCILPFHRVLLPLLCTPSLHFPYNYNYTHTLNHFLPDLQQVAESELSPAAGSGRAIAITKEEGVTKRVLTENLPQLHSLDRAWFSPVYWFIGLLRQWNINKLVAKGDKYVRPSSKPSNCFIHSIKNQRSHSWTFWQVMGALLWGKKKLKSLSKWTWFSGPVTIWPSVDPTGV